MSPSGLTAFVDASHCLSDKERLGTGSDSSLVLSWIRFRRQIVRRGLDWEACKSFGNHVALVTAHQPGFLETSSRDVGSVVHRYSVLLRDHHSVCEQRTIGSDQSAVVTYRNNALTETVGSHWIPP